MASYELASQFTEDAFAKEDLICERSACAAKILKGDPCFYIATIVIGQRGRFVCATCHRHYQGKAATSMRPTAQRPNPQRPNPQGNAQVIRQNINAAWRPAVAQQPPPRVVATSAGPDIAVPSSWAQPGYSVNHAQYGAERERWAKQAYAVPPAETISLEITAVREGGNRRKGARGIPFGNICEGRKDVDARIDAPGLITLSLDTILPKIQAFATGFPWRQDQFVIRDGGWVDLSTHPPRQPYFYSQCTQATRKGLRAMTFKSKIFLLYVVVPTAQWEDYETWLEKAEEERFSMGSQSEPLFLPSATRSIHSSVQSSALAVASEPLFLPSATRSIHSSALAVAGTQADSLTISSVEAPSEAALSKAPVKRPFQREIASVPSSPPLKKMASANVGFRSPDREQLREVLQSGGTTDIDVRQMLTIQHENIEFFPIPTRPLSVILDDPKLHAAFRTDTELSHSGRLTVQTSTDDMLGVGGFKTAHPGFLTLLSAPEIPLGSRPRQKVAVKRPFYKKYPPGSSTNPINFSIGRYTISDELPKLFREANVLYWARSLLTFAYEYIDHCVANSSDTPPFHIPRLRFVEAGLALSHDHTQPGHKSKSLTMPRAGYLVEELITDDFIKYIHNMDCNPMLDPYEVGYEIAEFLACTQHIQFAKTGGLAFISDYQGGLEILSDPQVLTHPLVNKGKDDIFGDGNIERAVSTFEKEHNCNKFCKWSGFKLKIYEKLEIDEAETETD
ncbi:hypothetical protein BDR07DRAFT_1480291 [Suillus spraguei]|nr:hypothetical protein BDR07DRAFT_1567123 [Suillus spraguei]KAG2353137.1 hypothetical protein BDR07DRAFT_1383453 [Suillus spraguei]KAG2353876.1 hypothetical protein BDR07DRAFT_1495486 [Suillus spraguei]KAG2363101.1 hypothetical protein BDR07DRAFT_1484069 [Suillus spraguei]KAG2366237.1 hypothetical protein BDR07DRAFT_1480291 [Suillus spraguei]